MDPINPSTFQLFNPSIPSDNKKVAEAAKGFEAYFIQQMLQEMRKTIPKTEKSGFGSDIYQSMFDQALAGKMSEISGIGLAKQIHEALKVKGEKPLEPKVLPDSNR